MRPRRVLRPARRRIFLGCEGESERGYGALLQRIIEARGLALHLDLASLGGGDPFAIVQAAQLLKLQREQRHGAYDAQAVLLDCDRVGLVLARDAQMFELARQADLVLIWQNPCHEALLLRHLPNCRDLRPPDAPLAIRELTRRWPEYSKGLSAIRLSERIGEQEIRQAAEVEPDLAAFLHRIGLI